LKTILACLLLSVAIAHANPCNTPVYLTFDTGNMAVAHFVADTLRKHQVKATFFLANEKTTRGDFSLDDSWSDFWKNLQKDGHAFGNHTYYHTYYVKDLSPHRVQVKPQFGPRAGQLQDYSQQDLCRDLEWVDRRFLKITGRSLDPIWRAPGGKTSDRYTRMGHACGYSHVGWSQAGFLGDELSSEKYPNEQLLQKALKAIKPGDILMAHLGIWSRKYPWAPAVLEPLILGLKAKGVCFSTIAELQQHPRISRITP